MSIDKWITETIWPRILKQRQMLPDDLFEEWLLTKIDIEEGGRLNAIASRNEKSLSICIKFKRVFQDALRYSQQPD